LDFDWEKAKSGNVDKMRMNMWRIRAIFTLGIQIYKALYNITMSLKYNAGTLKKLENLLEEARFIVRYEKGNFNSGHCILEDKRIVVVNKFFNLESKINCLIDIDLKSVELTEDSAQLYLKIAENKLNEIEISKEA
jgi:hypothetical protein